MTDQAFSLMPFPGPDVPAIQITGSVHRQNGNLNIDYYITGETENIRFPERSISPMRKDGLWADTCFEFFLAPRGNPQYWEFNLSPAGDWNVYRMDAYRRVGFREEVSIQHLTFEVKMEPGSIAINARVQLAPLISDSERIQVGVSCIVQNIDQHETYWALAHPETQPDFHLRESFLIEI